MVKSKVLTRAQGVMDVVTYERAEQLLLPVAVFAELGWPQGESQLLSISFCFPQASLLVQSQQRKAY